MTFFVAINRDQKQFFEYVYASKLMFKNINVEIYKFCSITRNIYLNIDIFRYQFTGIRTLKELFLISVYCNKESHKFYSCFNSQIYILQREHKGSFGDEKRDLQRHIFSFDEDINKSERRYNIYMKLLSIVLQRFLFTFSFYTRTLIFE